MSAPVCVVAGLSGETDQDPRDLHGSQTVTETDRIKCVPSSLCGRRDSNPRLRRWQRRALTKLSYYHMKHHHSTNLCRTQVNPFPQRTHGSYQDTPASPHSTLRHNEVRVPSASDRTGCKG